MTPCPGRSLGQSQSSYSTNWRTRTITRRQLTFPADDVASQRVVDGERGKGYGYPKFISHADLAHKPLTNTQYLKDDTLIFRVSAEAPDYKPWLECTN